jgi:1,2-diacylglycerol 3-beta-galactosyltransferase
MPGQEEGNVTYVVREGAGVWAPDPERVVATLRQWVEHPDVRLKIAAASKWLARPHASREIARLLVRQIEKVKP